MGEDFKLLEKLAESSHIAGVLHAAVEIGRHGVANCHCSFEDLQEERDILVDVSFFASGAGPHGKFFLEYYKMIRPAHYFVFLINSNHIER